MKKTVWILIVILTVWLCKLSVDVYSIDKNNTADVNSQILQQNQKIASLNDQIIALKQSSANAAVTLPQNTSSLKLEAADQATQQMNNQKIMIKDRLDLINIFVQQKQFDIAVEQIQWLKQKLIQETPLAESVNNALIEALARDQNAISLYIQQRAEHQALLQQELQQIDLLIDPQPLTQKDDNWNFSSWFSLSKAKGVPDLHNRESFYQEQKLRLLLAQQALAASQLNYYYAQIQQIQKALLAYPDQATQHIVVRLRKLEDKQLIAPPTLSALVLFEGV